MKWIEMYKTTPIEFKQKMSGIMDIIDIKTTDQKEMANSRHWDNSTMARESGTTIVKQPRAKFLTSRTGRKVVVDRDDFCSWSHIHRSSRPDPQAACASHVRRTKCFRRHIVQVQRAAGTQDSGAKAMMTWLARVASFVAKKT